MSNGIPSLPPRPNFNIGKPAPPATPSPARPNVTKPVFSPASPQPTTQPTTPVFSAPQQHQPQVPTQAHPTQPYQPTPQHRQYPQPQHPYATAIAPQQPQVVVKKGKAGLVMSLILGVFLVVSLIGAANLYLTNQAMAGQIDEIKQEKDSIIQKTDQEKQEIQEKLDTKETFGAMTQQLLEELRYFNGKALNGRFDVGRYQARVVEAYENREDPYYVEYLIEETQSDIESVKSLKDSMEAEKASNATGTNTEGISDELSQGYATIFFYNYGNAKCDDAPGSWVAACVWSNDHRIININTDKRAEGGNSSFIDWYYKGLVYHEYAHVIQFANKSVTDAYLPYFDNDVEKQADCFADAYFSGDFSQYAYNKGCNGEQNAKVKEWYEATKFTTPTLTQ